MKKFIMMCVGIGTAILTASGVYQQHCMKKQYEKWCSEETERINKQINAVMTHFEEES